MANLLWVPGPWGPDLGRYAKPDPAPEAPPTSIPKAKAKTGGKPKTQPATLTPSAQPPQNDSDKPDSGSAGVDA
jgi:hypothetical protein